MRNISQREIACPEVERLHAILLDLARGGAGFMRDPLAAELESLDLTPPQLHAVMWLGCDGALTMGELARRCGITEKTITGIVDRLERAGLLARVRDDADRRVVHAQLTAAGVEAYRQYCAEMHAKLQSFLSLFEEEERVALFQLLQKLIDRLGGRAQHARKENV